MFKFSIVILVGIGTISTTLLTPQLSVQARIRKPKICVDPLPASKLVTLTLKADKQVMSENNVSSFQAIAGKASVKRGDIIMYTVVAKNNSRCPLKNLVLKQPIPKGTEYVKGSAMAIDGAELLFSIDGGKTFSTKPTVGKQVAPENDYNYLRWRFIGKTPANAQIKTTYKLRIVPENTDEKIPGKLIDKTSVPVNPPVK
jgi:uncharacterized repeat protein (TIGR01451 family)